ncbi:Uncharacterized protein OBRU01_11768 [Operophtera brumata]|uniref:GDP-mannose 4,6-dehydratase n=1 Tax=Operophtera brumata TaxID=104452 RepID=A0A0L7LBM7_OPEBR|nr:Uncharacterized protein OBRU01_11768 [Operophtera brumata]
MSGEGPSVNHSNSSNSKVALITGITGQDGSYLAEFLIEKGYEIRPKEIYNLGAQSHVKISFELSEYTAQVDAIGTLRLLEAVRVAGLEKDTKIYQASTSELYGKVVEVPQTEKTPFYPRSPYAYGMFACNGLLFNHESPRRGENFVTRKITRGVAKITLGLMTHIELGTLDSKRDWGHAKDYAMWLMLQQKEPEDFVVATGETHSVREFVEKAFACVGRQVTWRGTGVDETGHDAETDQLLVKVNPKYFRQTEVAKEKLGWVPRVTFDELVRDMVTADLSLMKRDPAA